MKNKSFIYFILILTDIVNYFINYQDTTIDEVQKVLQ